MPRREITEIERLKAKNIIDGGANKVAKWAVRCNRVPLFGGKLGHNFMEMVWEDMGRELGQLFKLSKAQTFALSRFPKTHDVDLKYLWGRMLGYVFVTTLPDLGLLTSWAVEDLARSMTKTMGWILFCIVEEGKLSYKTSKPTWIDGWLGYTPYYTLNALSRDDLRRIIGRAKSMS